MSQTPCDGVLLCCHGTVERNDQLAAFITNIRRGREPTPEVLAEVTRRYEHIGGSPYMRITHQQAAALEKRLQVPVRAAGRLWDPYPAEALQQMYDLGVRRPLSLPLAPQSVHIYHAAAQPAASALGMQLVEVPSWGERPELVDAFSTAIMQLYQKKDDDAALILSAHSLPLRVIKSDPYEQDFRLMCRAVVSTLRARGLKAKIEIAFQSQGMGGGQWLGPTLEQVLRTLAPAARVVIAPIGFLADHVETLYDIDVEARQVAAHLGIRQLDRMPAMDCREDFIDALAAIAIAYLA